MIRYEGRLGDLDFSIEAPGSRMSAKGYLDVLGPPDKDGLKHGLRTKVTRYEIIELIDLLKRML